MCLVRPLGLVLALVALGSPSWADPYYSSGDLRHLDPEDLVALSFGTKPLAEATLTVVDMDKRELPIAVYNSMMNRITMIDGTVTQPRNEADPRTANAARKELARRGWKGRKLQKIRLDYGTTTLAESSKGFWRKSFDVLGRRFSAKRQALGEKVQTLKSSFGSVVKRTSRHK